MKQEIPTRGAMRRIAIVSKSDEACAACKEEAERQGFVYDEAHPDVVLSFGGDGTLLHAERRYPSVPKLPLRNSRTCKKCSDHPIEAALAALRRGSFQRSELTKIEAHVLRRGESSRLIGLNDVILRNRHLEHAIRFSVEDDEGVVHAQVIGDGVVAATPFGSGAYYQSITKQRFSEGLMLAFNNATTELPPLPFRSSVTITLLRGPAELAVDNMRFDALLEEGDRVVIMPSEERTTIVTLT